MWMERKEDSTTVGCIHSKKIWNLKCVGTEWLGVIGNCTDGKSKLQYIMIYGMPGYLHVLITWKIKELQYHIFWFWFQLLQEVWNQQ